MENFLGLDARLPHRPEDGVCRDSCGAPKERVVLNLEKEGGV